MIPARLVAGLLLAIAAGFMGPGTATVRAADESVASEQEDAASLGAASRAATMADDYAEGLRLARRALVKAAHGTAQEATARLALGEALFRAGRLEEAGIAFRRCLHLSSETAA
ncbi:MAG: hypothetical protein O7D35_05585, partial [Acidobacteria bacterium]|nr:hypothetical protein [Acidobacteriota bacterium]